MENVVQKFQNWVSTFLAKPEPFLNNIPVCPYAEMAVNKDKINMVRCLESPLGCIEREVQKFIQTQKETVIFLSPSLCTENELDAMIHILREKYHTQDVWVLSDDPRVPETEGHLNFNFKESILVIIQSLTRLIEASEDLKKLGYYKNWSAEYFEVVVKKREKYYQQLLAHRSYSNTENQL